MENQCWWTDVTEPGRNGERRVTDEAPGCRKAEVDEHQTSEQSQFWGAAHTQGGLEGLGWAMTECLCLSVYRCPSVPTIFLSFAGIRSPRAPELDRGCYTSGPVESRAPLRSRSWERLGESSSSSPWSRTCSIASYPTNVPQSDSHLYGLLRAAGDSWCVSHTRCTTDHHTCTTAPPLAHLLTSRSHAVHILYNSLFSPIAIIPTHNPLLSVTQANTVGQNRNSRAVRQPALQVYHHKQVLHTGHPHPVGALKRSKICQYLLILHIFMLENDDWHVGPAESSGLGGQRGQHEGGSGSFSAPGASCLHSNNSGSGRASCVYSVSVHQCRQIKAWTPPHGATDLITYLMILFISVRNYFL